MNTYIPHWLIILGGVGQLFTALIYALNATFIIGGYGMNTLFALLLLFFLG
ncbi:MAG: hypothetical protein ABNH00_04025 [Dokdonia sp.]|jgi:hypothetical protein